MSEQQVPTGRLESWAVVSITPEYGVIWGYIHDDIHGRFKDGTWIHTSRISTDVLDSAEQGKEVATMNSTYLLGAPAGEGSSSRGRANEEMEAILGVQIPI